MKKLFAITLLLTAVSGALANARAGYSTNQQNNPSTFTLDYGSYELKPSWVTTIGHTCTWGIIPAVSAAAATTFALSNKMYSPNAQRAAGAVAGLAAGYLSSRFGAATYFLSGKGLIKSLDLEFLDSLANAGPVTEMVMVLSQQFRREKYPLPAAFDALHTMNVTLADAYEQFVNAYQRGSNPEKCQLQIDNINIYCAALARAKQIIQTAPEFQIQLQARQSERDLLSKEQMADAQAKIAKTQKKQFIFEVIRTMVSGTYQVITDHPKKATAAFAALVACLNLPK